MTQIDDFFRSRLDQMIDLRKPLAVLATHLPWQELEASVAHRFARQVRTGKQVQDIDLFGPAVSVVGAGYSNAGRPRLPMRLMISLLYMKHAFNESDEDVCERWSDAPTWQYFSGQEYFENRLPCDPSAISRFRGLLGEEGVEELLVQTLVVAINLGLIERTALQSVIVDSTVQSKAVAHPTDSRLLEVARRQIADAAKAHGICLKQSYTEEVECISKGKVRSPYEFGVKIGIATSLRGNLIVGARSFPGNPYDGHTLAEQLEQSRIQMEAVGVSPQTVYTDLGYRGVDGEIPEYSLKHRGKFKRLTDQERQLLKRRQAVEPVIGHLKSDHGMNRCYLKGRTGDAIHAVLCAVGFNIKWLLRMIARKGIRPFFVPYFFRLDHATDPETIPAG